MKNSLDRLPVLKQAHHCYSVESQSYDHDQDLNVKARIEEAEKLIQSWSQDQQQINEKLRIKMSDRNLAMLKLGALKYPDQNFKSRAVWKRKELEPLQLALDKLCSANRTCQGRTGAGSCSSPEGLNPIRLHYKMQHKTKSLAQEKQLLKGINAYERKAGDSCISVKELNNRIKMSYHRMEWERNCSEKKQLLRKVKELEVERDKAISNADSKGKIWDSLGSKEAIQNQIRLIGIDLDGIRMEHSAIKDKIKHFKKEVEVIEKDKSRLQKKLVAITQKKDETYKYILELRKLYGKP